LAKGCLEGGVDESELTGEAGIGGCQVGDGGAIGCSTTGMSVRGCLVLPAPSETKRSLDRDSITLMDPSADLV
jgi:hypothetical protein